MYLAKLMVRASGRRAARTVEGAEGSRLPYRAGGATSTDRTGDSCWTESIAAGIRFDRSNHLQWRADGGLAATRRQHRAQ